MTSTFAVPVKLGLLLVAFSTFAISVNQPSVVAAQDASANQQRWAIVPIHEEGRALADLLTAELSTWDSVQLLERERIGDVLAELELSASQLQDGDSAMRLGKLSQADALALIDVPMKDNRAKSIRLRLVDARTSIRLLDVLLPHRGLEKEVTAMHDELRRASATLRVPFEELRLIGVVPIKSGEPGTFLDSFCKRVTTLLEVGLNQDPKFIVVERSELRRLLAESDVSGLPLQVRAASRLLEASIRRADGGVGMLVNGRLVSHAAGNSHAFKLTISSRNPVDVRAQIMDAVSQATGELESRSSLSLEEEASIFDRRATLLKNNYREYEAAEMADVAMALAPSLSRLRFALGEYANATKAKEWHVRMAAGRRHQELRIEWWARSTTGDPMRKTLGERGVYSPSDKFMRKLNMSNDEQRLVDDWYSLGNRIYDQLFADAKDVPRRLSLLNQKLKHLNAMYASDADFTNAVQQLTGQMLMELERAGVPKQLQNLDYADFAMSLTSIVKQVVRRTKPSGAGHGASTFATWLGNQEDLAVRVAHLYYQAITARDEKAAITLLSLLDDWKPNENRSRLIPSSQIRFEHAVRHRRMEITNRVAARTWRIRSDVISHMPSDRRRDLAKVLQLVQDERDATELLKTSPALRSTLREMPDDQKKQFAWRVSAAIAALPRRPNYGVFSPRPCVKKSMADQSKPVFSVDDAEGVWQDYVATPIRLTNVSPENYALCTVFVQYRDLQTFRADSLILVWARTHGRFSIERVGISGGTPHKIGPDILGAKAAFRDISVAVSPDAVFVASESDGFVMLQEDSFDVFTEEQGAPSNDVWRMVWYRDRLYIAFKDSFASFDPKTKSFQLLASGTSIDPRNPLDGRGSFFIRHLIADEPNSCIWMSIQDNALPRSRNGFWQFNPETNAYQKVSGGHVVPTRTDGGMLLHISKREPLAFLNSQTEELTTLPEFASASIGTSYPTPLLLKIGDHVISDRGKLHTRDGQEYQFVSEVKWSLFQRLGRGFLTHYETKSKTLWYVEPKN